MTGTASLNARRDPSKEQVEWAASAIRENLTGEDRRMILTTGRGARAGAVNHPACRGLLSTANLDEIELRAAAECASGIVGAFLRGTMAPISGGAPARPADQAAAAAPKGKKAKAATGGARMTLHINGTPYGVRPIPTEDGSPSRAFELRKADGTRYHVGQHDHGPECDCPDFVFHRDGIDPAGCKHIKALALFGMVRHVAGGPPDPFGPVPRPVRSGQVTAPSDRHNARNAHPGLDTSRGGHPA